MLSKMLLTITAIALFGNAWADDAKTEAPSNLGISYHGEYYILRDSTLNSLTDTRTMHSPTVSYKLPMDMKVTLSSEFKYSKSASAAWPNRLYRALLSFSKSNILTEKEFGFKVDAGVARRYFDIQSQNNAAIRTYGNNRVNVTISKTFGENNASLFAQILQNDTKVDNIDNWEYALELIPTINLQLTSDLSFTFTDDININTAENSGVKNSVKMSHEASFAVLTYKLNDLYSVYLQPKWNHDGDFQTDSTSDNLESYLGLTHTLSPKASATAELGWTLMESHDGKFFSDKKKYPELAFYLDVAF